jgi:hypothetical protein
VKITLTDVATGWTECLPLLYRSQETVLAAIQRARTLFPFPILGIDTDNGGELINEIVIACCEQEHIVLFLAVWKQANEERATRCKYIRDGNNNSFETSLVAP